MNIFSAVNNLFFPPHCIFCDRITGFTSKYHICEKCEREITPLMGSRCRICMRKTRGNFGTDLCAQCRSNPPSYDRLRACYDYDTVSASILRLKFSKRCDHAGTMGMLMANLIEEGSADYIIPVPISRERLRERGYNQSELIAKEISRITQIPLRTDILAKVLDNKPQSSLKYSERTKNVKNAYSALRPADTKGKRIILIDDVSTTRSTISECAKTLKSAGAASVECVTFAVVTED